MTFKKGHTILKGHKHSEETKKKISIANKGRVFSDEWRKNLSESHKGQVSWCKGKILVPIEIQKQKRKAYRKEWTEKNKDKLREQGRLWDAKNRDRVNEVARLGYKKNRHNILARRRRKLYGIDTIKYDKLNNKHICPVCKRISNKNLSIDHNHLTGKIRGFICNNCNVALGRVNDSALILRELAKYLDEYK